MSLGLYDEAPGATPLTPEEREGLIPTHITLRSELNELEQANILDAVAWAAGRRPSPLKEEFVRSLHKRMFGQVWRWAGSYRTSDKNIGCDHRIIIPELYRVLDDARYWVEHQPFSPEEIGVRFHHALVFIHPFANGNGRWSRSMADLLMVRMGPARLSWGGGDLGDDGDLRQRYIDALHAADDHDIRPLLEFACS